MRQRVLKKNLFIFTLLFSKILYLIVNRENGDVKGLVDVEVTVKIGHGVDEPDVELVWSDVVLRRYVSDHGAVYHRLRERAQRHDDRRVLVSERSVVVVRYQTGVLRQRATDDERLTRHHEHHVLVRMLAVSVSKDDRTELNSTLRCVARSKVKQSKVRYLL